VGEQTALPNRNYRAIPTAIEQDTDRAEISFQGRTGRLSHRLISKVDNRLIRRARAMAQTPEFLFKGPLPRVGEINLSPETGHIVGILLNLAMQELMTPA